MGNNVFGGSRLRNKSLPPPIAPSPPISAPAPTPIGFPIHTPYDEERGLPVGSMPIRDETHGSNVISDMVRGSVGSEEAREPKYITNRQPQDVTQGTAGTAGTGLVSDIVSRSTAPENLDERSKRLRMF